VVDRVVAHLMPPRDILTTSRPFPFWEIVSSNREMNAAVLEWLAVKKWTEYNPLNRND
jgi:hypothetical protein